MAQRTTNPFKTKAGVVASFLVAATPLWRLVGFLGDVDFLASAAVRARPYMNGIFRVAADWAWVAGVLWLGWLWFRSRPATAGDGLFATQTWEGRDPAVVEHALALGKRDLVIYRALWVPSKHRDVTDIVTARVTDHRLGLQAHVRTLGDPFKGEPKELVVLYSVGNGPMTTALVAENEWISLPTREDLA